VGTKGPFGHKTRNVKIQDMAQEIPELGVFHGAPNLEKYLPKK
jgi:hypothetical protein